MGMVLGLTAATDETISAVLEVPRLVWKLLGSEGPDHRAELGSWFSRIFSRLGPASTSSVDIDVVEETDLDKSWHGIHYLLTGTVEGGDPPLNFLLLGGREVGRIDVGYGTARAFHSTEVRQIHQAISAIDEDTFLERFVPAEMARLHIYPDIWMDDTEIAREYCLQYFKSLTGFARRTAEQGCGFVIYIS